MYSDAEKRKFLDKIINSEVLKGKDIYQKLLEFIVEAGLKNVVPTEISISQDVFNKGEEFISTEDTTVRVYVHNLRKKLDQYYQEEGKHDQIKLLIPKGHYRILFEKNTPDQHDKKKYNSKLIIFILSVLLVFAIVYIILDKIYFNANRFNTSNPYGQEFIWDHFFDNGFQSTLLVGDFLVFHEYNNNLSRARRIQDYSINTEEELNLYISENKDKGIEKWTLGELPHNIIFNIIDLNRVFFSFDLPIDVHFTTEVDIDFIKNRNVIYIGEFKNLRALTDIISFLPIKYQTLPWWQGSITYQTGDSLTTLNTFHDWGISRYVVDLGIVVKLPGQNKENFLIIAGFGYDSQIKLVEMLSDPAALARLEEQIRASYNYVPNYFAIVFEITGFDRASTNAEMKFFHEIKDDYYKQYNQLPDGLN